MMNLVKVSVLLSGLISSGIVMPGYGQVRPAAAPKTIAPKDGTALVDGTVLDANTKQPVIGAVVRAISQAGTMRAQQVVTTDGSYKLTLDPKQPYVISTEATGYESLDEQLSLTSALTNRLHRQPIYLYRTGTKPVAPAVEIATPGTPAPALATPVSTGPASATTTDQAANGPRLTPPKTLDAKVIYAPPLLVAAPGKITQLRAIQFVQSKAELLPDAQPALDQLLSFMRDKPTTEILLAGHTDNQGDFDQNVLLSKQRVDLVKEFLVKNGIAANRISTRGYGPTRPVASNNAEGSRQQNRRVEMIVLKQ